MPFRDVMDGIGFFAGLSQGFSKQLQEERKTQEHQNIQLLTLLHQDGTHSIEQVDPAEIETGGGGLFGQRAVKTRDGSPAFKVAGSYFTAKKLPTYTAEQLMGSLKEDPTPQEINQTPLSTGSAPAQSLFGTPPPPVTAPKATPTVQPQVSNTDSVRGAVAAYQKLDPATKARYDKAINAAAVKYGHTPEELYAQIGVESRFNTQAKSPRGALGPSQFMPTTAQRYGLKDPTNIEASVDAQARYLKDLKGMFPGDDKKAYAGYNAGEGAVQQYGGIPPYPETQGYVKNVLGARGAFRQILTGQQPPAQLAGEATPTGRRELPALTGKQIGILPGLPGFPGRPIIETEDGGSSTHRTVTVPVGKLWYQIPAMFGGKEVSEDEARSIMIKNKMVDPETGEKMQGYPTIEEADKAGEIAHKQLEQRTDRLQQKSNIKPPGERGNTSMQVAGEGAAPSPPPSPTLPALPVIPTLPKESAYIQNYILKNAPPGGFTGPKGLTAFKDLRKEATADYKKHIDIQRQERSEIRLEKKTLLEEEHDPQLRPMLEQVNTTAQLDHYLQVRSAKVKGEFGGVTDPLTEATKYLQALGGSIPDQEAAKVYNKLLSLGYKPDIAKQTLSFAGYDDQKALDKNSALLEQKSAQEAKDAPRELAKQAAKERQTAAIHKEGAPDRLAEKAKEATIFKAPVELDAELSKLQGEAAKRGEVDKDLTQTDYVALHPEAVTLAQQNIDKRKTGLASSQALAKETAVATGPLKDVDLQRYMNPKTGEKPKSLNDDGSPVTRADLVAKDFMILDPAAQRAATARRTALDDLARMRVLAFGGKDKQGMDHPGVFTVPSGAGARGKKTVATHIASLSAATQEGIDAKVLDSLQQGLLTVYAKGVSGETAQISNQDIARISKLFPSVALSGLRLQDALPVAKQLYDQLEMSLTEPMERIIGNGVADKKAVAEAIKPVAKYKAFEEVEPELSDATKRLLGTRKPPTP